jgi:hypothetical protein
MLLVWALETDLRMIAGMQVRCRFSSYNFLLSKLLLLSLDYIPS